MHPSVLTTADTLPVHWLWFQVLLLLTFVLHLLLMNLILGGSLLTVWESVFRKRPMEAAGSLPTLIALTINLGVPPLLFVQVLFGKLFYTSSLVMAVPWILVIPILILAYYGAYLYVKKIDRAPIWAKGGLIVSSLFLLYIAFMWVNNSTLAVVPERWQVHLANPGGGNFNLSEPTLLPRYLHFIIAALAVASLGKAVYFYFSKKQGAEDKQLGIRRYLKLFGWFSLVQMGIGVWFWLSLPKDIWMLFMGRELVHTVLMLIGWLAAIGMIWFSFKGKLMASLAHGLLVVALMAVIRELVRSAYLKDLYSPAQLEVVGQYSPFIAFLLVFAAGLLLLYYMIRLILKPQNA